MDEELQDHKFEEEKRFNHLESKIEGISERIEALETSIASLVVAWNAASGVVAFVKWFAGIAASLAAVITLIKMWNKF